MPCSKCRGGGFQLDGSKGGLSSPDIRNRTAPEDGDIRHVLNVRERADALVGADRHNLRRMDEATVVQSRVAASGRMMLQWGRESRIPTATTPRGDEPSWGSGRETDRAGAMKVQRIPRKRPPAPVAPGVEESGRIG